MIELFDRAKQVAMFHDISHNEFIYIFIEYTRRVLRASLVRSAENVYI